MRTNKGYAVSGLQRAYHPKTDSYSGWSGRVRVVNGNPFYDEYVKFNSDGTAFNHGFGDIDLTTTLAI